MFKKLTFSELLDYIDVDKIINKLTNNGNASLDITAWLDGLYEYFRKNNEIPVKYFFNDIEITIKKIKEEK